MVPTMRWGTLGFLSKNSWEYAVCMSDFKWECVKYKTCDELWGCGSDPEIPLEWPPVRVKFQKTNFKNFFAFVQRNQKKKKKKKERKRKRKKERKRENRLPNEPQDN
jgi:hypothetical protein